MNAAAMVNYWASFVFSYRRLHLLTQDQLAQRLEVSQQTVSRWEAGQQIPDPRSQISLRRVLGEADLSSKGYWLERVRRCIGAEALLDRNLILLSLSDSTAKLFGGVSDDFIGKSHADAFPKPRPENIEKLAQQGFFDGAFLRAHMRTKVNAGTRSFAYALDLWPILTSDSGILMQACLYPVPTDQEHGVEGTTVERYDVEPNELVGGNA